MPENNEMVEVDTVQLWFVEWMSRHGEYSTDLQVEIEAFTSLETANAFKNALDAAFKLLKHTSGT